MNTGDLLGEVGNKIGGGRGVELGRDGVDKVGGRKLAREKVSDEATHVGAQLHALCSRDELGEKVFERRGDHEASGERGRWGRQGGGLVVDNVAEQDPGAVKDNQLSLIAGVTHHRVEIFWLTKERLLADLVFVLFDAAESDQADGHVVVLGVVLVRFHIPLGSKIGHGFERIVTEVRAAAKGSDLAVADIDAVFKELLREHPGCVIQKLDVGELTKALAEAERLQNRFRRERVGSDERAEVDAFKEPNDGGVRLGNKVA